MTYYAMETSYDYVHLYIMEVSLVHGRQATDEEQSIFRRREGVFLNLRLVDPPCLRNIRFRRHPSRRRRLVWSVSHDVHNLQPAVTLAPLVEIHGASLLKWSAQWTLYEVKTPLLAFF